MASKNYITGLPRLDDQTSQVPQKVLQLVLKNNLNQHISENVTIFLYQKMKDLERS